MCRLGRRDSLEAHTLVATVHPGDDEGGLGETWLDSPAATTDCGNVEMACVTGIDHGCTLTSGRELLPLFRFQTPVAAGPRGSAAWLQGELEGSGPLCCSPGAVTEFPVGTRSVIVQRGQGGCECRFFWVFFACCQGICRCSESELCHPGFNYFASLSPAVLS